MRYGLLLLVLLWPLCGRSQAAPDSATAIRWLFGQRRPDDLGVAVGGGGVVSGTGTTAASASPLRMQPGAVAGLAPNCSLLTLIDRMRYSVRREQEMLRRLALHRPLPAYVRREMGPVLASR